MAKLAVAALVALLIGSIWFMVVALDRFADADVPTSGIVAMWLGIIFSLLVGCGLMALVFYSSRRGHDR
jgi:hypothetical protein